MGYTPTTWNTGDTITASALNKMEQGIADGGGGALIVNVTLINGSQTMDKTYAEIYNAFKSGTPCYMRYIDSSNDPIDSQYNFTNYFEPITIVYKYDDTYRVYTTGTVSKLVNSVYTGVPATHIFQVSTSTDYPTLFRTVYTSTGSVTVTNNWG